MFWEKLKKLTSAANNRKCLSLHDKINTDAKKINITRPKRNTKFYKNYYTEDYTTYKTILIAFATNK